MNQLVLLTHGKLAAARRIIDNILYFHRGSAERINEALAAGDLVSAAGVAHSIKGMAGQIGAKTLMEYAATADDTWRCGRMLDREHIDRLLAELAAMLAEGNRWLGSSQLLVPEVAMTMSEALDKAMEIKHMISMADGRATEAVYELCDRLPQDCPGTAHKTLGAVAAALSHFDFDRAEMIIATLILQGDETSSFLNK